MQQPPGDPFNPGGAPGAPGAQQPGHAPQQGAPAQQPGYEQYPQQGYPQQPYGAPPGAPGAPGVPGAPGQPPYGAPPGAPGAPGQQMPPYGPPPGGAPGAPTWDSDAAYETGAEINYGSDRQKSMGRVLKIAGVLAILFGVVCLITSYYFTTDAGKTVGGTVPPQGGTVGPIEVKQDLQVLEVKVLQPLNGYGWSYVNGEVLDANEDSLMGFGYELWHEQGYDEGHWDERVTTFDFKITVPKKGKYFLYFDAEQQAQPIGGNITVRVTPKTGSGVPHFAAGIFGLVLGVLLIVVGSMITPVQVQVDDD